MTPSLPRRLRASVLIALCCFLIYNANRRAITAGDTYPARYLPFAIAQHHTIFLDPVANVTAQGRGSSAAFWMLPLPDGHLISLYPVVVPVVVAPLYLPAIGYLHWTGWTDAGFDYVARVMEKLVASLIAAISAALLYVLLRRRTSNGIALLLTIAYAFGTTTWVISSQALWQHGLAQLLVIGVLLLVTGPCTTTRVTGVGFLCALIAANRPPDAVLAIALGVYALCWAGRRGWLWLAAGAALPVILLLAYNLHIAGNFLGGYGRVGSARYFRHDVLAGIGGLLISPARGLFVFSPFLLFLLLAWRHMPRDRDERRLTLAMTFAIVIQLVIYAKGDWRGGLSWGPRYMTDVLPMLMWMLVPIVTALRGFGPAAFVFAVVVSIAIEAIGAFYYVPANDSPIFAADAGPRSQRTRGAWQWRNAPFVTSWNRGRAPVDLAFRMRGAIDPIETSNGKTYATGWAVAGNDTTPWKVEVIVDGKSSVETYDFVDRRWRVAIDSSRLAPGEHHLTAFAWVFERGDGRYLGERKLTVRAVKRNLEESSRLAAARIREDQQRDGYWLTQFTSGTRFQDSRPEMNTFLTSLVVDALDPVAARNDLEESVQRARAHLTKQIEPGGLVRYHGLPNGPGIGTLGCAITPDTDDTSLVWRIAPPHDRSQLDAALATIDQYRTSEGLYRTWLAPRAAYQCLDPGSDPNPTDIGIQMNLLLLLSEVRPAAARSLCDAIRPLVDEDRVWVYYRKAPLMPLLRVPDLRRAGCELQLPESRMRSDVAGQEVWINALRLLDSTPDRARIGDLLHKLAADDFAYIRTNPPLFYHNDLTATVSRYYWSEDFGYALWLRLYDRYENPNAAHALD